MKYKIEIWVHYNVVETYENNDINEVLNWYRNNWQLVDEKGECYVNVSKDNKVLSFEEKYDLGFYD